jgi:hypothetical protein
MRARIFKQAGWTGFGALIILGCARANPLPIPVQAQDALLTSVADADEETSSGSSFDNLDIVDASLNEKVAVLRVGSQLGDNNLLTVFAGLKNKTGRRVALEVETIYKDKDGNALNAGSWIPMTLKPYEECEYRSASISEEAVDFLVRIRHTPNAASTHG